MSFAPEGLDACILTGGLAPIGLTAEEVYERTLASALNKTKRYYKSFPDDLKLMKKVANFIKNNEVTHNGNKITVELLRMVGYRFVFGMPNGHADLHFALQRAFTTSEEVEISCYFKEYMLTNFMFNTNPMYAIIHETIYPDGPGEKNATNFAADRVMKTKYKEYYTMDKDYNIEDNAEIFYFVGEVALPQVYDNMVCLQPFKEVAYELAKKDDWTSLYNPEQLMQNKVPTVAIAFYEDFAVDREASIDTAGMIQGCKVWITNEFEHDGVKQNERVIETLLSMLDGTKRMSFLGGV